MKRTMLAAGLWLGLALPAMAATPAELKAQLDAKAPGWLKTYGVPSVSVAYIVDGKLAWTAVYGEQSPGVPATDRTLYNVASMAKPVSAEIALRLASEGKLSLDEPMAKYWVDPDIKDSPWLNRLTPRISMHHQTGFPNWRYQTKDMLSFQWEPGTKTGYSGEGYEYMGRFLEKRTGRGFEDLAQSYIFDPLGMKDSAYSQRAWFAGRLAWSLGPKDEWREGKGADHWLASDNLETTTADYARFMISVMKREALTPQIAAQRTVLAEDQKAALCAADAVGPALCPVHLGFGLGWGVFSYPGETVIQHGGSDWGEKTEGFFVPERGLAVIIFTNGEGGSKVIRDVAALLYDRPGYNAYLALTAR